VTNDQALSIFGSRKAIAEVCDVTESAVAQWFKHGGIPYDKQCLLQVEAERVGKRRYIARKEHDPKYLLRST
jgi:DNA-binding transcriptional regulator YdaS (Cro superfamily)